MISRRVSLWALAGVVALGLAVRLCFLFRPIQVDESYTSNEYASDRFLKGWVCIFPITICLTRRLFTGLRDGWGQSRGHSLPAFWCGLFMIPATYAMVAGPCGPLAGLFAAALAAASARLSITRPRCARVQFRRPGDGAPSLAGRQASSRRVQDRPLGRVCLDRRPGVLRDSDHAVPFWRDHARACDRRDREAGAWEPAAGSSDRRGHFDLSSDHGALHSRSPRNRPSSLFANPFVTPLPRSLVQQRLPVSLLEAWRQWHLDIPAWLALVLPVPWLLGLCRQDQRRGGMGSLTLVLLILLAWTLAVAWLQRVIPYDRVWLFLLPVYLGCVGAGLAIGVEALAGRRGGPALRLAAVFALGLGLGLLVVRGDGLDRETHQLSLYDADAITEWLKPRLRYRDAVVALSPCDGPLKSSFIRHRVPTEWLHDYWVSRRDAHLHRRGAILRPDGRLGHGVARIPLVSRGRNLPWCLIWEIRAFMFTNGARPRRPQIAPRR